MHKMTELVQFSYLSWQLWAGLQWPECNCGLNPGSGFIFFCQIKRLCCPVTQLLPRLQLARSPWLQTFSQSGWPWKKKAVSSTQWYNMKINVWVYFLYVRLSVYRKVTSSLCVVFRCYRVNIKSQLLTGHIAQMQTVPSERKTSFRG